MKIRAVIFDVYETLLRVGPAPADAEARWRWLWENHLDRNPRLSAQAFAAGVESVIAREHAAARERGIVHPEVYWPSVLGEVVPELAALTRRARAAFEQSQARISRTTSLNPGATPVLRLLLASGVAIGIASNAQPYTVQELDEALSAVGLGGDIFQPDLVFWSFQHGFSKPDPHVFQVLGARLRARGIRSEETLMVGDRRDNDIAPARAFGWRAFHLNAERRDEADLAGDWQTLARWLDGRLLA